MKIENIIIGLVVGGFILYAAAFVWKLDRYVTQSAETKAILVEAGYEEVAVRPDINDPDCMTWAGIKYTQTGVGRHRDGKVCNGEVFLRK